MIPNKPDYSSSELMSLVQVPPTYSGNLDPDLLKMAFIWGDANFTTEEKIDRIRDVARDMNRVSIGKALEHLATIADIPDECQGNCDGLDALCYHLDENTVRKAISALHAILDRFAEWGTTR